MVEERVVRHRLQIPSRYSPSILLNPVVSQTPTCIAFPRGGNTMMSLSLVLASWTTRLAAGYLHCCWSSADPLSRLLSARRPHLQFVLGPLALMQWTFTFFLCTLLPMRTRPGLPSSLDRFGTMQRSTWACGFITRARNLGRGNLSLSGRAHRIQ